MFGTEVGIRNCGWRNPQLIQAKWRIYASIIYPSLVQIMACRLFGAKPLSEPMMLYSQLDRKEHISVKFYLKLKSCHSTKCTWKCLLRNSGHFVSASMSWWNGFPQNSWWRHQMETFSALLAICARNSPMTGEILVRRPVTRSLDFSLICAWINDWVNNREAGDLRRYGAHYDVDVMWYDNSSRQN